jgi:hypothetical protein
VMASAACAIAAVFGAIHCIGWSFAFPSDTERILWHISSVTITGIPIALALLAYYLFSQDFPPSYSPPLLWDVCLIFGSFAYGLSRLFLLILSFLSLRALPREAYLSVHWTALIPHIR